MKLVSPILLNKKHSLIFLINEIVILWTNVINVIWWIDVILNVSENLYRFMLRLNSQVVVCGRSDATSLS